jgi:hypothetical protein
MATSHESHESQEVTGPHGVTRVVHPPAFPFACLHVCGVLGTRLVSPQQCVALHGEVTLGEDKKKYEVDATVTLSIRVLTWQLLGTHDPLCAQDEHGARHHGHALGRARDV